MTACHQMPIVAPSLTQPGTSRAPRCVRGRSVIMNLHLGRLCKVPAEPCNPASNLFQSSIAPSRFPERTRTKLLHQQPISETNSHVTFMNVDSRLSTALFMRLTSVLVLTYLPYLDCRDFYL